MAEDTIKNTITKKIPVWIIGLIATILIEIFVFNFSAVKSVFYKTVDITDSLEISYEDGAVNLGVSGIDRKVDNIFIDVSMDRVTEVIDVGINLTDEGNAYEYTAGNVSINAPVDRYINTHSCGKADSIRLKVTPDSALINRVCLNAKRPLYFNLLRVIILYIIFAFFYVLRDKGNVIRIPCAFGEKKDKKQMIITAVVLIFTVLLSLYLTSSHRLFNESSKPHHQQYKELARALKEGNVYLPDEPSEGLVNAQNPYDTIYLQANGIEYKADYAYFDGKYYVYFGIVPEVFVYLPYHMITGKDFPNHAAVFLFYLLFASGVYLLYAEMIRRYFIKVPFAVYLIVSAATTLSATIMYVVFTADIYSVPIISGLAFTSWGLALYFAGIMSTKRWIRILFFTLGSFCISFVAGCRPQMLITAAVMIPVFYDEYVRMKKELKKPKLSALCALILPFVLSAVFVMWYNKARFGSVFDFGATYSLTNNDMNNRRTGVSGMLLGLISFLFGIPRINGIFPFIHSSDIDNVSMDYVGRITSEFLIGGIIISNILTVSLLFLRRFKKVLKNMHLYAFVIIALVSSLVIGCADSLKAGILQRYSADMVFGILIASAVMIFMIAEYTIIEFSDISVVDNVLNPMSLFMSFLKVGSVIGLFYSFFIICNTESGITLREYAPKVFYSLRALFRF